MKIMILIVLIFVSTCSLAINQRLIDGANKYVVAVRELENIASEYKSLERSLKRAKENKDTKFYVLDDNHEFHLRYIDEANKQLHNLAVQYNAAKEVVEKLEPIKKKYDKQKEKEGVRDEHRAELLSTIGTFGIPLSVFMLVLWLFSRRNKKYQQLLKDGKINQEEYDRMMQCNKSSMSDDEDGINPATGLPMTGVGVSDVGGNIRGSSSDYSSSSSSDHNRSSWDRWY